MNYDKTGINAPSAVGVFAEGRTPVGAEEMTGNVWEWTRSVWGDYPYTSTPEREDPLASDDRSRVLRGGAFLSLDYLVRCAARGLNGPGPHYYDLGFRVVPHHFSDL